MTGITDTDANLIKWARGLAEILGEYGFDKTQADSAPAILCSLADRVESLTAERAEIVRLCEDGRGPAYADDPVADVRGLVAAWKTHEERTVALRAKLVAVRALAMRPRTFAESISRDFAGDVWPIKVTADELLAILDGEGDN